MSCFALFCRFEIGGRIEFSSYAKYRRLDAILQIRGVCSPDIIGGLDPIGIFGYVGAMNEYDSYVPGICRLLHSGASVERLADHLYFLETKEMGMTPRGENRRTEVARKLVFVHHVTEEEQSRYAEFRAQEEAEKHEAANSEKPHIVK